MKRNADNTEPVLDALLDDLKSTPRHVPDDLLSRVLADAQTVQAAALAHEKVAFPVQNNAVRRFLDVIGGWPSLAAFTATACFGVGAGYAMTPETLFTEATDSTEITLFSTDSALSLVAALDGEALQ